MPRGWGVAVRQVWFGAKLRFGELLYFEGIFLLPSHWRSMRKIKRRCCMRVRGRLALRPGRRRRRHRKLRGAQNGTTRSLKAFQVPSSLFTDITRRSLNLSAFSSRFLVITVICLARRRCEWVSAFSSEVSSIIHMTVISKVRRELGFDLTQLVEQMEGIVRACLCSR